MSEYQVQRYNYPQKQCKKVRYLTEGLYLYGSDIQWQIDESGKYEMTPGKLSHFIWGQLDIGTNDHILETCGGLGGDTVVLTQMGASVIVYEPNRKRCDMLWNNVALGGHAYNSNLIRKNFDIKVNLHPYCNILYMDPPWGGPEYKNLPIIENLSLGTTTINEIVMDFSESSNCLDQMIVLKLPFNYNIKKLENMLHSRPWRFTVLKIRWIRPPPNKRSGKVVGIGWFVADLQKVIKK